MTIGLFEILGLIASLQLMLLSMFLFSHKRGNRTTNSLLAFFLLANAIIILDVLQLSSGLFQQFPHLVFVGFSTTLLLGPILYFHARAATSPDFEFKALQLVHLIPFLLFWSFLIVNYHTQDIDTKIQVLRARSIHNYQLTNIAYGLIHIHIISYVYLALQTVRQFLRNASNDSPVSLSWLVTMLWIFLAMWLLDLVRFLASEMIIFPNELQIGFQFLSILVYFTLVNYAVYRSLKQPELFNEAKKKYATSLLTEEDIQRVSDSLVHVMAAEKPYLISTLTIDEVATKLAIPSRHLSQVINHCHHQNFIDFVNGYRIEEAKRLFTDAPDPKKTILEVLYEVGFNSKSAFNSAFKKHTGITPTEFRKNPS